MKINVKKINAFTDKIYGGNPAGFVFNPPDLTDRQMTHISKIMNVSETAFINEGENSDYTVRFFSPELEVNLCGHATIAAFYNMAESGLISKNKVTQKTKSGTLSVEFDFDTENNIRKVMMIQAKPKLKDIYLDIYRIADSLNISIDGIDQSFPIQKVSTGLFTLPVCVKNLSSLKKINPNFSKIRDLCLKFDMGSFHVFTFETYEKNSVYHSRNFAPLYGINEDPVTGTANGAVCSYLVKNNIVENINFICEQGDIIGRPGRVFVDVENNKVRVGGIAKFLNETPINI